MLAISLVEVSLAARAAKRPLTRRITCRGEPARFVASLDGRGVADTAALSLPTLLEYMAWLRAAPTTGAVRARKAMDFSTLLEYTLPTHPEKEEAGMPMREVSPQMLAARRFLDAVGTLYSARDDLEEDVGRQLDTEDWRFMVLTMLSHIEEQYGNHDPKGLKATLKDARETLNKLCRATDSLPD